jgi:hypothetical protein
VTASSSVDPWLSPGEQVASVGAGARANHYLPALPRSAAARLAGAVVDEAVPPF